MKYKYLSFLISCLSLTYCFSSFGWGQKGHDTVAFIAENHLTPKTKSIVDSILGGKSMVYYANWADNACYTVPYSYTKTWHYKNVDENQTYESAPNIESGNIVTALNYLIGELTNPNSKEGQKVALILTVHFLGDIHQPMHLGRASDRGGNRHNIKFFNNGTNLHKIWDSNLVEIAHKWSYSEWQNNLDRLSPQEIDLIILGGTPDTWAKETYEIAKKVYKATPENTNVGFDYIANWTPVIEKQFLRGGLRLADLLNSVFDPDYQKRNGISQIRN